MNDDDWPDPADLCRGLLATLASGDRAASDWAGELIVAIDRAIGDQVAVVLSDDRFATLHAVWRSVGLLADAAVGDPSTPPVEIHVVDASAANRADGDWSHHLLYAGPLDTRGGRPISLLIAGSATTALAAVAERAICPALVTDGPAGPFVIRLPERATLRGALSADPAWAGWFNWPTVIAAPLRGPETYAVAAEAIRSVVRHGWPFDVADDDHGRLLMAARVAQIVAVRCRGRAGRPPGEIANEIADGLRGRHVGPRLPLRWVDVAVETSDGRLACTLRMSPRLGGDDPVDVPVTIHFDLAAGYTA